MSLEKALAPSHRLLIKHSTEITPPQLSNVLECYGAVDDMSSYHLKDKVGYVTLVQYSDPASTEMCYLSFRSLISSHRGVIKQVAWVNENCVETLKQRPYIGPLYRPDTKDTEQAQEVFMVLYLSQVSDQIRSTVLHSLTTQHGVTNSFIDTVNGGRCFLRYPSIETAQQAQRTLVHHYPEVKKHIHYCDYTDFMLAEKGVSSSLP